jgi:hypothetical protein
LKGRISTTSIRQGEQVQGGVMESFRVGKKYILIFLEEEENECVREELICYV